MWYFISKSLKLLQLVLWINLVFLMVDLRPVPKQFRIRSTIHQEENDGTISFSKE